jgi:hypothetical protein
VTFLMFYLMLDGIVGDTLETHAERNFELDGTR